MDRRERQDDPIEATKAALDGKQAEIWTALPCLVESFNPVAMTVVVQPAIKGQVQDEKGKTSAVDLPLLVDVPVVFPCGGGFTLTYPIKKDDECLVVFASRCIDGWWQNSGVKSAPDERMHDLSDGFALIGPRSQPRKLEPAVDTENVQLRTDDGKAHITIMPDYTIRVMNPNCSLNMSPDGEIISKNTTTSIKQSPGGEVEIKGNNKITLDAPLIVLRAGAFTMEGKDGGTPTATIAANIEQQGWHNSTQDQVAGGKSTMHHVHVGDSGGTTGEPS